MSIIYSTLLTTLFICASSLQAQTTETVSDTLQLDHITITATKIPVTERETSRPVNIINRKEIESSTGRDFAQLLNLQSGIRINNSQGTPSGNQTLFMQGAGGDYTLILIDGMPVKDPSGVGGAIDLRQLPVNNIERIEILKGNQATLYGSDALAGVINIITKKSSDNVFESSGSVTYGAYNTFNGSLGVNGSVSERLNYVLNANLETSDGISAATDPTGAGDFERDGFSRNSFYGKITVKPTEGFSLSPSVNYSAYEGDYDADAFQDAPNTFVLDMFNPALQAVYESGRLRLNSSYNYTRTNRLFSTEFSDSEFEGRYHNLDNFGIYRVNDNLNILGGLNYQDGNLPDIENESGDASASFLSPYATVLLNNIAGFTAEIGYRLDNHSEYGQHSSYSFSPSYQLTENLKLFASYGTGFKAPTLSELFGPFGANPNLEPETSREYRAGFEAYLLEQSLKISAHYFDREIDNLIVYSFDPGYVNRDREVTQGFDISANWIISHNFTLGGYYNYLSGETITLDDSGSTLSTDGLIRKPNHNIGINAGYRFLNGLFIRFDGEITGERTDLFFNPENNWAAEEVILDSYFLLNAYAEYSLFDNQISLFGTIRNLLNRDFTEVYGFNTMGIHATAGARFRF